MDETIGYEKKIEEPDTREEPTEKEDYHKIKTDEDEEDGKEDTDLDEDTARDEKKENTPEPKPHAITPSPTTQYREGQKVNE